MWQYFTETRRLGVSLLMVAPLLVAYQAGLLIVGVEALNGADFVTRYLLTFGGRTFLLLNLAILFAFGVGVVWLDGKGRGTGDYFIPVFVESLAYALGLGTVVLQVMAEARLLGPEADGTLLSRLVLSAGAGIHEELVFRLLLMGGLIALGRRFVDAPFAIGVLALAISSVLFSLAHFRAEPFDTFAFWFRTFAGGIFGVLYWARGFAIAVYTHAFYDVFVLVFRP